jgi:hypothetical protein
MTMEVGTFTWPNNNNSQTITLVGSFTPKAIIMWGTGPGTTSDAFSAGAIFSIGFGTRRAAATQSGCNGYINVDNVGTSDTARVRNGNTALLHILANATTTDYTIALDGFGVGQVGISSSNGTNTNGDRLHYIVFDVEDAIVINHTMNDASTEVVTGAGFQPEAVFGLYNQLGTTGTITAVAKLCLGFASSSSAFSCFMVNADDGDTMTSGMQWCKNNYSTGFIGSIADATTVLDALWDLDSFDSDGATLGVVDAPAAATNIATLLFLKGGTWEAGILTKDTDAGVDTFALANGSLTPSGVVLFDINGTVLDGGTFSTNNDCAIGATDGTREHAGGITCAEAINTATDRHWSNTKCMVEAVGNGPTETNDADFSSFAAGSFALNWTSVTGAIYVGYMAYQADAAAPTAPDGIGSVIAQQGAGGYIGRVYV